MVVYISDTNAIHVASTIGRTKPSQAIRRYSLHRTCGDIAVGHHCSESTWSISILSPRTISFALVPFGKSMISPDPGFGELRILWARPGWGTSGWM